MIIPPIMLQKTNLICWIQRHHFKICANLMIPYLPIQEPASNLRAPISAATRNVNIFISRPRSLFRVLLQLPNGCRTGDNLAAKHLAAVRKVRMWYINVANYDPEGEHKRKYGEQWKFLHGLGHMRNHGNHHN
ncbi:hypothetical protein AVEN_159436-1 [Araneus ventricosus]|uniref:Uncharacterized protein n=1 Tax=Araneus ventricosus TaxID=182803 RepID=A0A4Y2A212_ARAVE|nr:hypothetical protein AVEN_159436-1 [Araneus ventricosus]